MRSPDTASAAAGAAAAAAAYAVFEKRWYALDTLRVPVRRRAPQLTVLHLSDTHLKSSDKLLLRFLRALPDRLGGTPDLVIATGDLIEDNTGIDPLVEAFAHIEARLGRFYVLGSHDYYQSKFQSYVKYFIPAGVPPGAPKAATDELEAGLRSKGWMSLTNTTRVVDAQRGRLRLVGVDDPYINRHETGHIDRGRDDALAIGVVHAPDVVSEWALHGFDLVLAGHTHGGQVRLPLFGAVVTNCTLPAALARGLSRVGETWLHVSPGLGTGRFTPIRFNCRPAATLLQLDPSLP